MRRRRMVSNARFCRLSPGSLSVDQREELISLSHNHLAARRNDDTTARTTPPWASCLNDALETRSGAAISVSSSSPGGLASSAMFGSPGVLKIAGAFLILV